MKTKKPRAKSCKRNYPTTDPNVFVHIVWADSEGKVKVTGYPRDQKGKRVNGVTSTTRTSRNLEDREEVISRVRAIVEKKLNISYSTKKKTTKKAFSTLLNEETSMVKAFRLFQRSEPYVHGWCSSTLHNHMTYFENNILPYIQNMEDDEEFGEAELQELKQRLLEKAINNGNSDHRVETAMKRVEDHIAAGRRIYSELLYVDPTLPSLAMLKGERLSIVSKEQFKLIPFGVHRNFRKTLEELVSAEPYYVRGAVLMDMGLRAGEAAAITQNEIKQMDEGVYILVIVQEKKGERSQVLKSDAAYRVVPCDEWAAYILDKCNAIIGEEPQNQTKAPVIGSKLSAWTKSKLIESGCTEELLRAVQKDLGESCEYDDDVQSIDISGHLLRRHRASVMYAVMGYSRDEIEVFMGHRNDIPEAIKEKMLTPGYMKKMLQKNARYDLFGELLCSSPKYVPIEAEDGTSINIIPFEVFRIKDASNEPIEVTLNIAGMVVGEEIEILTDGEIVKIITTSSYDENDKRNYNIEIIGKVDNKEDDDDDESN